jgi:hypothetical protein
MTFDDKSASEPRVSETLLPENPGNYSFGDVVDEVCEKLKDRQIKYSIRRIQEMEERLYNLDRELEDFLGKSDFLGKQDFPEKSDFLPQKDR